MNRAKIEDILLAMGVPAGIKGFNYIADAIEYVDEHGAEISVTKELYPAIAKKRKTTSSRVERAIRHALGVARSKKGNYKVVEKYIGFADCTNFNSLVMLYKRIKRECEPEHKEVIEKEIVQSESETTLTALEIREIIRQELRMFLNELKAAQT